MQIGLQKIEQCGLRELSCDPRHLPFDRHGKIVEENGKNRNALAQRGRKIYAREADGGSADERTGDGDIRAEIIGVERGLDDGYARLRRP